MSLFSRLRRLLGRAAPPPAPVAQAPRPLSETLDFNDPAIARDPFGHWEALRAQGPVQLLPRTGGWMVLGFDEVKEAFARPDIFSNAPYAYVDAVLLGADPPAHTAARRLVAPHFTPKRLGRIEELSAAAARAAIRPRFDAVGGFARPVTRALAEGLLGFDAATLAEIDALVGAKAADPLPDLLAALEPFGPRAGIYHDLLRDGAGLIDEAEARSLVRLLWFASVTTTDRTLAHSVLKLVEDPPLQQRLRGDRTLLAPFVEEVMRLHPPEQALPRIATADAELGGKAIPAGAMVFLSVGAANRDPAMFEAPAELRLERGSKRHLAFGGGIHHCVGGPLARRVVLAALGELLDGTAELRAAEPLDAIPWSATLNALAPTRLEVET